MEAACQVHASVEVPGETRVKPPATTAQDRELRRLAADLAADRDGERPGAAAWRGISDLEGALEGVGPRRPTLGEALTSLDRLLCDGLGGRANEGVRGGSR